MRELVERIRSEAVYLGDGLVRVDSFLNHQVDTGLVVRVGRVLGAWFAPLRPTRVLTAEASGIAPAFATAMALGVPLVYARKTRPATLGGRALTGAATSRTRRSKVELVVSAQFLGPAERVLVVDDFLGTGGTLCALAGMVREAGAMLAGIGCVIEKRFEGGRPRVAALGAPLLTLASLDLRDGALVVLPESWSA